MKEKTLSLEEEIKATMDGLNEVEEVAEDKPEIVENPKEDKEVPEESVETVVKETPKSDAPTALSGAIKAKWNELPEDVRNEWKKREDDFHRAMTSHDGDLRVGRTIKEIAAPYEAIIRMEGGTVEGAFKDLLNSAYILRTGTPQQKQALLLNTAQQYGIDLRQPQQQNYNPMDALQREIQQLREQANPELIKKQLQESLLDDKVQSEINAFAANPKNVHFETVKPAMGSLMSSGQAKNLQEAYDMACWSNPSIRSELLAAQNNELAAKKKAEMAAKKKAASSVAGSPGLTTPKANTPDISIEDDIRAQLLEARGGI